MENKDREAVEEGSWLYAGTVRALVRIVRSPVRYGTGDYEDPPEIRHDAAIECYYLEFCISVERDRWGCGGVYESIGLAKSAAEKLLGDTLKWHAES